MQHLVLAARLGEILALVGGETVGALAVVE
jgi:hypothetical protein